MTTRREITDRIVQLFQQEMGCDDIEAHVRIQFHDQPPSVLDAAWTKATVLIARDLGRQLQARLDEWSQ